MACPLYNSFIPIDLRANSARLGSGSLNETHRNGAIEAVCGIPASVSSGFTVLANRAVVPLHK